MERDLRAYIAGRHFQHSAQELGAHVSKLFAERREATNRLILQQLAKVRASNLVALGGVPPSMSSGSLPASSSPSSFSTGSSTTSLIAAAPPSGTALTHALMSSAPGQKSGAPDLRPAGRRFDRGWVAVVGLTALAVTLGTAAATVFAFKPTSGSRGRGHVENESNVTKPITVTLRATPLETQFWIDDGPPLDNPYIGMFPRDRREHVIRAAAPGYPPKQETVIFRDDVSLRFALALAGRSGR
jgi:hypothetical protein